MRVREVLLSVLCVIGAACAGRTVPPAPRVADVGRYKYSESVPGGMMLSGEFVVLPDTVVVVSAIPAPCPAVRNVENGCEGTAVYLSSIDPVHASRYTVVVTTQKQTVSTKVVIDVKSTGDHYELEASTILQMKGHNDAFLAALDTFLADQGTSSGDASG